MIKSMTGFGRAKESAGEKIYQAEIRSLNSKQLDLNLRLPSSIREKESDLRNKVALVAERGKVDVSISTENSADFPAFTINLPLAKQYHGELKMLAGELGIPENDFLPLILKMPEVMKSQNEAPVLSDADWKAIKGALDKALTEFDSFRKKEGSALESELKKRIALVISLLKKVEQLDKQRYTALSKKIKATLKEHLGKEKIDKNRFEQELIYYFEKLDISEEKLRLKTHCDYFLSTMKENTSGRKLGFIAQEIGREINTIGSKANDAGIQKSVVMMKDELEKIKEQLMNVL